MEDKYKDNHDKVTTIFDNRDALMQLRASLESNAKFVVDKIWANVKFFTTITSALLTTSLALYGSEHLIKLSGLDQNLRSLVFAFIPVIVIMISFIGIKNLRREYRRFLEWIAAIQKIQELMGLHVELKTKIFPEDKYLFPKQFLDMSYKDSIEFVESGLKKKDTLYRYFKILHGSYIVIAVIITLLFLYPPLRHAVGEIIKTCS